MWNCGAFILGSWGLGYGPVVEALHEREREREREGGRERKKDLMIYHTEHWDSPLWRHEETRMVKRWNSVVGLVTLTKARVSCSLKLLPQMDRPGMLRWAEGVVIDLKKQVFLSLVSQIIRSQSFYLWLSFLTLRNIPPGRLLNSFTTRRTQAVKKTSTYVWDTLFSQSTKYTVRVRHRVQSKECVSETLFSQSTECMSKTLCSVSLQNVSETLFSQSTECMSETLSSVCLQNVIAYTWVQHHLF